MTTILAVLTFAGLLISLINSDRKVLKGVLAVLIGGATLFFAIKKNNLDSKTEAKNQKKSDSAAKVISDLKTLSESNSIKLDSAYAFLKRLDSLGLKRDAHNKPILTKQFINNIKYVGTLNQN